MSYFSWKIEVMTHSLLPPVLTIYDSIVPKLHLKKQCKGGRRTLDTYVHVGLAQEQSAGYAAVWEIPDMSLEVCSDALQKLC